MSEQKNILLIEDDADMHEAVKLILEPEGYAVTCCSTGPAGLQQAHRMVPDLILLDIMLSSPSEGFHLAYEFRKDDVLRDIPIIMISAIGQTMGIDYSKELGTDYVQGDRWLDKPIDAATLRQAVKELIG
jgi:CheY-like chemotaxis protein